MIRISPYFRIIRLANVLMTGFAVFLGSWLSRTIQWPAVALLMLAAMSATGFGNVINDIQDIDSDRISHPNRPLPQGDISERSAIIFALFLVVLSILSGTTVSFFHGGATLIPLVLLSLYAFYLKATPLSGNFLVALLVAYALLFGAIPHYSSTILIVPALLAFLLNFSREIVKDLQDFEGDRAAGYATTALIPRPLLKSILLSAAVLYISLLFVPYFLGHFGTTYALICILSVIPIHTLWLKHLLSKDFTTKTASISKLLKLEMLAGLAAMAADKL